MEVRPEALPERSATWLLDSPHHLPFNDELPRGDRLIPTPVDWLLFVCVQRTRMERRAGTG